MTPSNPAIEPSDGCVANSVVILGNKWTPLILLELSSGPQRFTQLERMLDGISPRTLAQRLDDLCQHNIITKQVFAETPPRTEYSLTQKGKDFLPVLKQMAEWGSKYSA